MRTVTRKKFMLKKQNGFPRIETSISDKFRSEMKTTINQYHTRSSHLPVTFSHLFTTTFVSGRLLDHTG